MFFLGKKNLTLSIFMVFFLPFLAQGAIFFDLQKNSQKFVITKDSYLLSQRGKKFISTEGRAKSSGRSTSLDFDDISITGNRRTPLGSIIKKNNVNKDYDLVKSRTHWHSEMINSATSLDTHVKKIK